MALQVRWRLHASASPSARDQSTLAWRMPFPTSMCHRRDIIQLYHVYIRLSYLCPLLTSSSLFPGVIAWIADLDAALTGETPCSTSSTILGRVPSNYPRTSLKNRLELSSPCYLFVPPGPRLQHTDVHAPRKAEGCNSIRPGSSCWAPQGTTSSMPGTMQACKGARDRRFATGLQPDVCPHCPAEEAAVLPRHSYGKLGPAWAAFLGGEPCLLGVSKAGASECLHGAFMEDGPATITSPSPVMPLHSLDPLLL